MKVVSERLGHSSITVTADLYSHVTRRLGNAAAEQIAEVLRTPSETRPTASPPQRPENDPAKAVKPMCIRERARPPPAFPLVRGLVVCLNTERARRDSNPQPSDP